MKMKPFICMYPNSVILIEDEDELNEIETREDALDTGSMRQHDKTSLPPTHHTPK
jgi:hypothetical protein